MGRRPRRKAESSPTPANWLLPLWEATKKKVIDNIAATIVVTATFAGSARHCHDLGLVQKRHCID
jgi:hypothetical protein